MLKIAQLLTKKLIPVEIQGSAGVGKSSVLEELAAAYCRKTRDIEGSNSVNAGRDINLPFQGSASLGHVDLLRGVAMVVKQKEKDKSSMFPLGGGGGKLRVFIDDVDGADEDRGGLRSAVKFINEYGSWILKQGAVR